MVVVLLVVVRDAQAGAARARGVVEARVGLHVDQLVEVAQGLEAVGRRDVVDEQEGVGAEVRRRPHAAVLLLAGRVRQREVVRRAVDAPRDAVAILDGRVVLGRPLRVHEAQRDGGLAAAPVAADCDGDGHGHLAVGRAWWGWLIGHVVNGTGYKSASRSKV